MDKYRYKKAIQLQKFLNFSEFIALAALYKRLPKGCVIEKNVSYSNKTKSEICDLIYKKGNKDIKMPLMLYIHGGGWISGVKNMRRSYCYNFAEKGFFVVNVHYDYAPQKQHPYQLQQLLTAIDFVFDNAEKYNIDTTKVLLAGESAGGYFVCELAAIAGNKELLNKIGLNFKHRDDFLVTANIVNCGAIDLVRLVDTPFPNMGIMLESYTNLPNEYLKENADIEKIKLLSPTSYIEGSFPPTFIIYAANDPLRTESFHLKDLLDWFGVANSIFKGEGIISRHAFPIATKVKRGKECLDQTLKFIMPYF